MSFTRRADHLPMNKYSPRSLIFGFARSHKLLLSGTIAALFVSRLLNVLLPLSIGLFVEIISAGNSGAKARLTHMIPLKIETADAFFKFFGVLVLLKGVLAFFEKFGVGIAGEAFSHDLRNRAFSSQMMQTMESHRSRPVGRYLLRYSGDLTTARNLLTKGLLGFAGDTVMLAGAFTLLFSMRASWALVVTGIFASSATAVMVLGRMLKRAAVTRDSHRSKTIDFVSSRLQAFLTVKSMNRENRELRLFRRQTGRQHAAARRHALVAGFIAAVTPFFFFSTVGCVLWLAYRDFESGTGPLATGDVLAFILLLIYSRGPLRRIQEATIHWQAGQHSLGNLARLLNLEAEPRKPSPDDAASEDLKLGARAEVKVQELTFGYQDARPIFENINFHFKQGSITLISGDGKSSFLRLLLKFAEPAGGSITLGGLRLDQLTPFEARKLLALVSSDTPLIGKTVFEAISFRPKAEKRKKAARILGCLGFQQGDAEDDVLDLRLSSSDKILSDGESTLLQFARALMTGKKILLLDNSFEKLGDVKSRAVVKMLNRLKASHCIILAANRKPSGLNVDSELNLQTGAAKTMASEA